jgi:hypothetical protein
MPAFCRASAAGGRRTPRELPLPVGRLRAGGRRRPNPRSNQAKRRGDGGTRAPAPAPVGCPPPAARRQPSLIFAERQFPIHFTLIQLAPFGQSGVYWPSVHMLVPGPGDTAGEGPKWKLPRRRAARSRARRVPAPRVAPCAAAGWRRSADSCAARGASSPCATGARAERPAIEPAFSLTAPAALVQSAASPAPSRRRRSGLGQRRAEL